ncbi:MAG TPA: AAA family ATPase [Vicinamibacterales bacterium]|nr:AAA family ATPase [Vicinamibacterales bacterium]
MDRRDGKPPEDQQETIAFLATPAAYGLSNVRIERIDTHISIVFLAGDKAYKLKRQVRFDYVDFSTIEARRIACEAEVRINRRTAPDLYLGVHPVSRTGDGGLALGGPGAAVDWVVEMRRFDQATLFDRLADAGQLDVNLMPVLAASIVKLHAGAERRTDQGGLEGMRWVIDGNRLGDAELQAAGVDRNAYEKLCGGTDSALAHHAARLESRRCDGFVRHCHGDLHLRNICLLNGMPTLFDAIEFNDRISCIDVIYDLAFLLMDLWRSKLTTHAARVFNEYCDRLDALDALALLPLFLSCRAAVKAKTSIAAARVQQEPAAAAKLFEHAREYVALAGAFLEPRPPVLIAIGGFSGSGKTTLARAIAPFASSCPGARVLRSDVIRKQMFGADPLQPLSEDAYGPETSVRVYDAIADQARTTLHAHHSVVADAVFSTAAERFAIERVAREAKVPFVGLWLDGSAATLVDRVRRRQSDASDATEEVVAMQFARGAGAVEWHRIDASPGIEAVARQAESFIAQRSRH